MEASPQPVRDLLPGTTREPIDDVTHLHKDADRPQGIADLRAVKVANASEVEAGDTLTYDIRARNDGPHTARNVVMTDELPAEVTFVGFGGPEGDQCVYEDTLHLVTCTFGDIPPDGRNVRRALIHTTVNQGTPQMVIANTIQLHSSTADPRPLLRSRTLNTTIVSS